MVRMYELIYIISPKLSAEESETICEKILSIISSNSGEIINEERWGKRRLAYEINHQREGSYVVVLFKSSGEAISMLDHYYKTQPNVLRYLITLVPKGRIKEIEVKGVVPVPAVTEAIQAAPDSLSEQSPVESGFSTELEEAVLGGVISEVEDSEPDVEEFEKEVEEETFDDSEEDLEK